MPDSKFADWASLALARYDLPGHLTSRLVNISENITYKIEDLRSGSCFALRIHREGYHSRNAIASELAWLIDLRKSGVAITPTPVRGRNGEYIQIIQPVSLSPPRHAVLFNWENGRERTADEDLTLSFVALGELAARMHEHARNWSPPQGFERHYWDFDTSIGDRPHWGKWRDGLGLTRAKLNLFGQTSALIANRLRRYGKPPHRFGLVHADLRLANLLFEGDILKVIDFDDCGYSWFMYDAATAVSFFEHEATVPKLVVAWLSGYRNFADLPEEDEAEIPTFIMLRRLLLIAWIGSHAETDLAKSMGVAYTEDTMSMCNTYLRNFR